MVISPNIFSQIKGQSFSSDATLGCQFSLKISPESLKTIYVGTLFITVLTFAMSYQTMNITLCCNAGIALPCIREDNGTSFYSLTNQGDEGFGLYIRHYLSPNLTASTENAKNRSLQCATTTFGLHFLLALAFILPLTSNIGFINLNHATKYFRNILRHYQSHYRQSSQNSLPVYAYLYGNIITAQSVCTAPR